MVPVTRQVSLAEWARPLGISLEAAELYASGEVIDLHVDTFIWTRIFGYDPYKRHGAGLFGARIYGHVDIPRLLDARVTGATWVITTNPFRTARGRERAFFANHRRLTALLERDPDRIAVVRTEAEYRAARALGKHAAFIGVQGGNALDGDLSAFDRLPEYGLLRVTLVHLTSSRLGATSSPLRLGDRGLSPLGKDYVRVLNDKKIFVDLAHINRRGFFDAVEVHDKSQPLLVTHTGVAGVFPHWRNVDDEQLRAVADTGGVVGVMYHSEFLDGKTLGGRLSSIADHLDHIKRTVGVDHAALGSDWDGAIVTPRDMPTCSELPRLVDELLRRGWSPDDVTKVLGENFLRVLAALRG